MKGFFHITLCLLLRGFSLRDDSLILPDALLHRQEQKDHCQDELGGDLKAQEEEAGHRAGRKDAPVIE